MALPLFVSCSTHSESVSFASRLEAVDAFILQGDTALAIKELKTLGKKAYSSYDRLGVYKRYALMGENALAQNYLELSLKKLPENPELSAVYVYFLLHSAPKETDNLVKALNASECLKETRYAPLYAEALLTLSLTNVFSCDQLFSLPLKLPKNKKGSLPFTEVNYTDRRFIPVYKSASMYSQKDVWLVNAAVIYALNGQMSEAGLLCPEEVKTQKEAFFWGNINYSAGNFSKAVKVLQNAKKLPVTRLDFIKCQALLSDAYVMLNEEKNAHEERSLIIDTYYNAKELKINSPSVYSEKRQQQVLPSEKALREERDWNNLFTLLTLNSLLYERETSDKKEMYSLLAGLLDLYPTNEKFLALYASLALETLNIPEEDEISKTLRKSGLKTMEMEKRDRTISVLPSEALYRINKAIEQEPSASLIVLRENFLSLLESQKTFSEKASHVWEVLEKHRNENSCYDEEFIKWVTVTLVQCGFVEEARTFFFENLSKQFADEEDFVLSDNPEKLSLWQCEYAAWFYATSGVKLKNTPLSRMDVAIRLYTYIVEHYSGVTPVSKNSKQNKIIINALVNLGVLYSSKDNDEEALEVLRKAESRAVEPELKAEILYRMAVLQFSRGDVRSSILSLQHALSFNPNHNRAHLLLKKINVDE